LIIALVGRSPESRKHAMHAAVALALVGLIGTLPRIIPALRAGDIQRPAVVAQIAMAVILLVYVALGVRSFIAARRARQAGR
jgi:hypothetical protein